jgi:hypothetical protein
MFEGDKAYLQSVVLSLFAILIFFAGYLLGQFVASKRLTEVNKRKSDKD